MLTNNDVRVGDLLFQRLARKGTFKIVVHSKRLHLERLSCKSALRVIAATVTRLVSSIAFTDDNKRGHALFTQHSFWIGIFLLLGVNIAFNNVGFSHGNSRQDTNTPYVVSTGVRIQL